MTSKTDAKTDFDPVSFIRTQTKPASPAIVPELTLYLASEITSLWQLREEQYAGGHLPPPFWALAWPGGQGLARYLLDNPAIVRGKRVLDMASGSGIDAIAAMKAGAAHALAVDIDPMAHVAIQQNALLNQVEVETIDYLSMSKAPKRVDIIIAGDICYEQAMATRLLRWLWLCVAAGIRVLMADPGRAYVPESGLTELATYIVPTSREVESDDSRTVKVWDVGLPTEET